MPPSDFPGQPHRHSEPSSYHTLPTTPEHTQTLVAMRQTPPRPPSEPATGTMPKRTDRLTLRLPDLPQARLDRVSSIWPCCNAESLESTPYGTTRAHIKRITPICHPHMPSFIQTSCRPDYSNRSTRTMPLAVIPDESAPVLHLRAITYHVHTL